MELIALVLFLIVIAGMIAATDTPKEARQPAAPATMPRPEVVT